MKQILQKYKPECAKYFCNKHPSIECYSGLEIISWYGSCYDCNKLEIHLCDECVKKMYDLLKKQFNVNPKQIEI